LVFFAGNGTICGKLWKIICYTDKKMKKRIKIPDQINPSCKTCESYSGFELDEHLIDEFQNGDVVLFAGAGISSESKTVLPTSFYEHIANLLELYDCKLSFSKLMEKFCSQPNGKIKLISEITKRLDNIKSFPELYRNATRFHNELATLRQLKTIITTNWDTYFEDECGAVPFMYPEDFALWEASGRKVLKIHGSINNLGSLVATESDYEKCLKDLKTGIAGSILKTLLATKTMVFVGYSFADEDFQDIYSFVSKEMNGFAKQAYVVTIDSESMDKFKELGFTTIVTDGSFFISKIKELLTKKQFLLPDYLYDLAGDLKLSFEWAHKKLYENYNVVKNPEILYCACYQDGAIHAFERMQSLRKKAIYSCPCEFINTVDTYKKLRKDYLQRKRYEDVAYIDGYITAHQATLLMAEMPDEECMPPLFYAYGCKKDIFTDKDYKKIFKTIPKIHKAAYENAKKIVNKYNRGGDFVFHHPAYL
jgi:hypothetical protein